MDFALKKLNIIFVCYNCGADIVNVVTQILSNAIDDYEFHIHIVDNASADDSMAQLMSLESRYVSVHPSEANIGFGPACNIALDKMDACDKVLLLNPDIELRPDSINNLLNFSNQHKDALIWGGVTMDSAGDFDGMNAWKEPSMLGVFSWAFFGDFFLAKLGASIPDAYNIERLQNNPSVDAVSGCFFLIDYTLFRKLKGFDERFFMYSEEIDLCRRARELGALPKISLDSAIIHHGSQTVSSFNKLNFLYHSKLKYCKKHWSKPAFLLARFSILTGACIRLVCHSVISLIKRDSEGFKRWSKFVRTQLSWRF